MKLNQHYTYVATEKAIASLTKAYFTTGDIKLKEFRDELEKYLNETECTLENEVTDEQLEQIDEEETEGE